MPVEIQDRPSREKIRTRKYPRRCPKRIIELMSHHPLRDTTAPSPKITIFPSREFVTLAKPRLSPHIYNKKETDQERRERLRRESEEAQRKQAERDAAARRRQEGQDRNKRRLEDARQAEIQRRDDEVRKEAQKVLGERARRYLKKREEGKDKGKDKKK